MSLIKKISIIIFFLFYAALLFSAGETFPFILPWDDSEENAVSLTSLIPPNAGSGGFIYVDSESHLATSSGRIRFWGTNATFDACFPSHANAEKVAARMRKFGINLVRFHHMDMWSIWTSTNPDRALDPSQLDKLDYFIYQLKLNGIYTDLNLLVSRPFAQGTELHPDINLISDWKERAVLGFFDGANKELQKQYASDLLTHVNPYTGNAYVNEPAVAFIEINNENGLIHAFLSRQIDSLPPYYDTMLRGMWNTWLQDKYTTHAAMVSAWNIVNQPLGAEMLGNGTFSSGVLSPWNYNPQPGVVGSGTVETGAGPGGINAAKIDVTTPGSAGWHVQFNQGGLNVTAGVPYTVTFYAKADSPRSVTVELGMAHDPWQNLGFTANLDLTDSWQLFTYTFTPGSSDTDARLNFGNMGTAVGTYWFTDISMKQGGLLGIDPSEDLDSSTVMNFKQAGGTARTADGKKDWFRFLTEVEGNYWIEMKNYVETSLGAQPLVFGTQIMNSNPNIQANFEVIDSHSYWAHPQFPSVPWSPTDWSVSNAAMVNNPGSATMGQLGMRSVYNRPHVVSEYNHCAPNTYQAEAYFFLAAYGSLQDWDALIPFDYNSDDDWDKGYNHSYVPENQNMVKMASHIPAAAAFLRGDIAPANQTIAVPIGRQAEIDLLLGAQAWKLVDANEAGEDPKASYIHKVKMIVEGQTAPAGALAPGTTSVSGSILTSDTGEIVWDISNPSAGVLTVDTAMSKMLVGFTGGTTYYMAGGVTVTPGSTLQNGFSCIAVTAKDGTDFASAQNIIITALGAQDASGRPYYQYPDSPVPFPPPEGINITTKGNWGSSPAVAEGIPAVITLPVNPAETTVWALDNTGTRSQTVAVTDSGGYAQFSIGPSYGALWYEVEVVHSEYTPTPTFTATPVHSATSTATISPTSTMIISDVVDDCENVPGGQNQWGGWWYSYSDADSNTLSTSFINAGKQAPGGPVTTAGLYHMEGNLMAGGYVGAGTNLAPAGGEADISGYEGISFYTRGDGKQYKVKIATGNFTDIPQYNTYEFTFTAPASWTLIRVPLTAFKQPNWGTYLPFETARAKDIQFTFETGGQAFSLDVDDLEFYYPAVPFTPSATVTETPAASGTYTATVTPTIPPVHTFTMTATSTFAAASFTPTPTATFTPLKTAADNLNSAYIYPSLLDMRKGNCVLRIMNLTSKTGLTIFNTKGEIVYEINAETPDGEFTVDFSNQRRKHALSPGLYIYVIRGESGAVKKGKFAIMR